MQSLKRFTFCAPFLKSLLENMPPQSERKSKIGHRSSDIETRQRPCPRGGRRVIPGYVMYNAEWSGMIQELDTLTVVIVIGSVQSF